MNLTFVKLEDDKECILLDQFEFENKKYVVLVNSEDENDFIVRQVINDELVGLESKEQFDKVYMYYIKDRFN